MPLPDQGLDAGFQGASVFEQCERAGLCNPEKPHLSISMFAAEVPLLGSLLIGAGS